MASKIHDHRNFYIQLTDRATFNAYLLIRFRLKSLKLGHIMLGNLQNSHTFESCIDLVG